MKSFRKILKNKALVSFLLSLLLGAIIVVPNMIINKGIFSLTADFNTQQIPFNKIINYSIKNGSIFWTWYNDLGSNFIATFSFYNLLSPFSIIGYLFPETIYEYLAGPLCILKYAVSGFTSYLFLKRYVKNKNYAVIGSLLYSFSGFQLTTLLFHFHDAIALFPLLLYTLDNLMYNDKKFSFAFVLAIMALTNWFLFVGQCMFLIIYFFVKVIAKEYKVTKKKLLVLLIEITIGILFSSIILIPTALFIKSNPRVNNGWTILNMLKYPNITYYLEIFKSFLFPSEAMYPHASILPQNYYSVELYLPVVGIVLATSYFHKNKKTWISVLMIILCVCMVFPILNSSFLLFQNNYYARWFYMPSLVLTLMSIKCLDNHDDKRVGFVISLLLIVIFFIIFIIFSIRTIFGQSIFDVKYFIISIIIMIVNLFLVFKNKSTRLLVLYIFIFVGIWGNLTVYYYKDKNIKTNDQYYNYLNSYKYVKIDKNSRINSSDSCLYNLASIQKNNNIKAFNSNMNGSSFEFFDSIGFNKTVFTNIDVKNKDLNDFLSIKYVVACNNEKLDKYGYKLEYSKNGYNVYYNNSYKNFGFAPNNYLSIDEYNKLPNSEKISILKDYIILTDDQIDKYKNLYNEDTVYLDTEFKFDKNGFSTMIVSNKETLALFTVPYDKGFRAYINREEVKIEKVDNGFMAIKINSGKNNIRFSYFTPGLKLGIIFLNISLLLFIVYFIYCKRKITN